jgi:hypothetical protein
VAVHLTSTLATLLASEAVPVTLTSTPDEEPGIGSPVGQVIFSSGPTTSPAGDDDDPGIMFEVEWILVISKGAVHVALPRFPSKVAVTL